jgi:hypothetical protein
VILPQPLWYFALEYDEVIICYAVENHLHKNLTLPMPDEMYYYLNETLRSIDALDIGINVFRNSIYLLNHDQYMSALIYIVNV